MIDHHKKSPVRVLSQDSKIPEENGKFRPSPKYGSSTSKAAPEMQTNRRASSCFFADDVNSAKTYAKACEQRKMKLIEMRNAKEKETTEGVHDFIKQVSDIIEKKTPIKESGVCSWPRGNKKNANSPAFDSINFNGVAKTVQKKKIEETENEMSAEEFRANLEKKLEGREKLISSLKRDSVDTRAKLSRSKSFLKKREKRDRRHEKVTSPESSSIEAKTVRSMRNEEMNLNFPVVSITQETAATEQKQVKRRRPSEIPLRKVRTDSTSRPKHRSTKHLWWEKNSNEVERSPPLDLSSGDKLSEETGKKTPEDQWQIAINVDLSCDKISIIGQEIVLPESSKIKESNDTTKLDILCGSSEHLELSNFPSKEVPEKKPSSSLGKKTKVIDLEKVKTSSFTVLKNNNTALNKLESLHKKNVLSRGTSANKENSPKDPLQKPLSIKSTFNILKGKSSKRSLLTRLSSKGNKPGLKTNCKRAKSYKEPHQEPENARKLKRSLKSKAGLLRFDRSEIEKAAKPMSKGQKRENHKKESLKMRKTSRHKKEESQQWGAKSPKEKLSARGKGQDEIIGMSRVALASDFESQNPDIFEMSEVKKTNAHEVSETETEVEKDPLPPPPSPSSDCYGRGRIVEQGVKEKARAREEEYEQDGRVEEDEWSSKTVILNTHDKFNYENYGWSSKESETEKEIISKKTKNSHSGPLDSVEKLKYLSLVVKGTSLNTANVESSENPKESESPAVRKRLKIDLRSANQGVEDSSSKTSEDATNEVRKYEKSSSKEKTNKEEKNRSKKWSPHVYSWEATDESGLLNLVRQKPRQNCSSLKRKSFSRAQGVAKASRRKKIRPTIERSSPSASSFSNPDMPPLSKTKTDTKMRSGLTKSSKWEEDLDIFEDMAAIKLKRWNSEPISFKGYVWRCGDVTSRDNKASVSSMTSSMRHLNTDEIDDFILWEAIPQRMTSCWEMSLYHLKRPWSVLSCSVFRDNRKSSTPGLILENLRSGGTLGARRFGVNQSERATCRKENAFDVEPSIAQKNIDIRNWLAALNFPTPLSTSSDAFTEGNFSTQMAADEQNLNKMNPKRRKVLSNLKFSKGGFKNETEGNEIYRKSSKWNEEGLTDLVQRKSGGFVTSEQFLNSEQSANKPNVALNPCGYSKSNEDIVLAEVVNRNSCEPRKYKSVEIASQPEVSTSAMVINSGAVVEDLLIEKNKGEELAQETATEGKSKTVQILNLETKFIHSDINIWKYLFLMTLFILAGHYCYTNVYVCRS